MRHGWRPTRALLYAAITAAVLLYAAVTLHRPDLVVLAAPLAAGLAVNLTWAPTGAVRVRLRSSAATVLERQRVDLVLRLDVPAEADLVVSTVRGGQWLADPQHPTRVTMPRQQTRIEDSQGVRWGRTDAGYATVVVSAAQGYFRRDAFSRGNAVTVLPWRDRFNAVDVLPHASGTIGAHRSRRRGAGSELDGIRPFAAGDRLKRINWPVSLRTGALHVSSTLSERDTTVLPVLDSSVDVGSGTPMADGTAGSAGSLDIAVHAAASVAEHYLRWGDRVGFIDHARASRPITPAAGRAHLDRIVDALLDVQPEPSMLGSALTRTARRIAPRATIMLFSPLFGAASPRRAVELATAGATVLVIDTLGDDVPATGDSAWNDVAWRLLLLERQGEIARLAAHGVPVVPWRGDGSLDHVLLALSRAAAAPKVRS